MKHVPVAILIAGLLAGCSDMASKDATIEDRAVASKDAKKPAEAKPAQPAASVPSQGQAPAGGDGAAKSAATPANKVETRGLAANETEVKSLDGSAAGTKGADGKLSGSSAQAGAAAAGSLAMDPKNPASPLAKRRILFDYDSSAIRDEYRGLLEAHAQYLKKEKAAKVILQGHADERGSREYNLALGQRRSESVFKAMTLLGVPDGQMEAVSLGEEKPVAEGHDEDAWKQNRRVEILYQGE